MCGIVGFVDKVGNKNKIIKDMSDKIVHRGPDDYGYFTDKDVALNSKKYPVYKVEKWKIPSSGILLTSFQKNLIETNIVIVFL